METRSIDVRCFVLAIGYYFGGRRNDIWHIDFLRTHNEYPIHLKHFFLISKNPTESVRMSNNRKKCQRRYAR